MSTSQTLDDADLLEVNDETPLDRIKAFAATIPMPVGVVLGASLLLNAALLIGRLTGGEAVVVAEAPPAAEAVVASEAVAEAPAAPVAAAKPAGIDLIDTTVEHSLARTFQKVNAERGDVISAVYARLFVWDVDLRTQLQKGDRVQVAYEWDGQLAHVAAASYASSGLGKTFKAYRFQAAGDAYPSWWNETGEEVPRRLENGPLASYDQITSLLKDRPTHKGMDFKVVVGEPVLSPKAGKVVRTDWNWKYNGNSVEVQFDDGVIARFLHLSETKVEAGQRVDAGAPIGLSGNTGRSTAPHLHYELEKAGKVLDPVQYHGVLRRQLQGADLERFQGEKARLDSLFGA